jgi:hypothetical protein
MTGFVNTEGLQDKLRNKDFLNLVSFLNILGTAESWAVLRTYKMSGYNSYFKERCNTAKYGRNPWVLAVNITDDISNCVKGILEIGNCLFVHIIICMFVSIEPVYY